MIEGSFAQASYAHVLMYFFPFVSHLQDCQKSNEHREKYFKRTWPHITRNFVCSPFPSRSIVGWSHEGGAGKTHVFWSELGSHQVRSLPAHIRNLPERVRESRASSTVKSRYPSGIGSSFAILLYIHFSCNQNWKINEDPPRRAAIAPDIEQFDT